MSSILPGYALWEPAPTQSYNRVDFGDVGFIRGGQFHLLFSAARPLGVRQLGIDVPATFEPLDIGTPAFGQPRSAGCLRTGGLRRIGGDVSASSATASFFDVGAHLSYELTGECGAALVTSDKTYVGNVLVVDAFNQYTMEHYDSWVAFAKSKHYGNVKPVLVSGLDMTKDFAVAAYSNDSTSFDSGIVFTTPMFGSASASVWGHWKYSCFVHTNHGPQQCIPPSRLPQPVPGLLEYKSTETSDDYNQCVFIRYYTMRKIMGLIPRVLRASAGPHDLGPGHNHDSTFPELTVQQEERHHHENDSVDGGERNSGRSGDPRHAVVVYNGAEGKEYDEFDVLADYVFRNSTATSVLMNHEVLAGIRMMEGAGDISSILDKHRPEIAVDDNGVAQILCEYPDYRTHTGLPPWQSDSVSVARPEAEGREMHKEEFEFQEESSVALGSYYDPLDQDLEPTKLDEIQDEESCVPQPLVGPASLMDPWSTAFPVPDDSGTTATSTSTAGTVSKDPNDAQYEKVGGLLGLKADSPRIYTLERIIAFIGGNIPEQNIILKALRWQSQDDIDRLFEEIGKCLGYSPHTMPKQAQLLEEVVEEVERRVALRRSRARGKGRG